MSLAATMPIMMTQVVAMFAMMAIGIILFKTRHLDNVGAKQLANVALFVATPAILVQSLATTFDSDRLMAGLACAGLAIALTVLSGAIAWMVFRDRQRISQLAIMISNMGFIGIPLVQSIVGEEYVFYISACIAAQVPITWTYGVWLISQDKASISPKRILTNPAVISVAVGVVLFLCSIELTGVLGVTAADMGNLNTGVAMLVLGSYLAQTDMRSLLRNRNLYATCALRLVVIPLLVILLLTPLPLPVPVKLVLVIGFSAPSGTISAMFPQMFGGDYRYGAGLVSLSTLLSLVMMPVMLGIALMVF